LLFIIFAHTNSVTALTAHSLAIRRSFASQILFDGVSVGLATGAVFSSFAFLSKYSSATSCWTSVVLFPFDIPISLPFIFFVP